eukprot:TRINITY_DN1754_c0_g1_i3.p1 TRINITY_DN1754_c0_g1~~TRINITY_DN1754_c0_g1_i3.p1  ORF type:complete len:622 (+),score=122.02 TRINITY_DN1754_c0_g1_i3:138-2003(+)
MAELKIQSIKLPLALDSLAEQRNVSVGDDAPKESFFDSPRRAMARRDSLQDVLKTFSTITIDPLDSKVWHEEYVGVDSPMPERRILVSRTLSHFKSHSVPSVPSPSAGEQQQPRSKEDPPSPGGRNLHHSRSRSEDFSHSWDYSPTISSKHHKGEDGEFTTELMNSDIEQSPSFMLYRTPSDSCDAASNAALTPRLQVLPSPRSLPQPPPEEVVFRQDTSGKKRIKAASADFLIRSLCEDTPVGNYDHVDVVILTHTTFTDSHTMLTRLVSIFDSLGDDNPRDSIKRARVVNAIKKWVRYNDVREDEVLIERISAFAKKILDSSATVQHPWALQLMKAVENNVHNSPKVDLQFPRLRSKSTLSILKKQPNFSAVSFCDIDPFEFSRHVTACDWKVFSRIRPSELINKAWSTDKKHALAPNIMALIDRFNKLCHWVATEIITTVHPKQRITVLERFIDIARGFIHLRNYHALVAMFTAFNMIPIQKLKSTWKGVSKKHLAVVKQIDQLFDSRSNFKAYRSHMKVVEPPVIPFEGIMLTDITFIYENDDKFNGLVNFEKAEMLGDIFKTLKTIQNFPYRNLTESQFLREFMTKTAIMNEDQLAEGATMLMDGKKKLRSRTLSK